MKNYQRPFQILLIAVLVLYAGWRFFGIYQNERERIQQEQRTEEIAQLAKAGFQEEQLAEVRCFPVAAKRTRAVDGSWKETPEVCFSYEDGFGDERTYGGERKHEGTDIMALDGKSGVYPVLSMTDGVIDKIGWLELGGYRVGIRSPSGVYYYYAHLDSYRKDLAEGQEVKAGDFLGFLGDSGYGEEGTRGQFPAHLHLGVYLGGDEDVINPYPLLRYAEPFMLSFCELENQ